MRVIFTHGSNINFQQSACEMTPTDLDRLLNNYVSQSAQLLIGTIHLGKQELHQFGIVQTVHIEQTKNLFTCVFTPHQTSSTEQVMHSLDELLLSHEAHFDVIEEDGQIRYQVAFVTFHDVETGEEVTYFFADGMNVEKPLAYVAAFWEQVSELGRDVDFSLTGCSAHDFAKKLAESDQK